MKAQSFRPLDVNRNITEIEPDIKTLRYASVKFADQKIKTFLMGTTAYVSIQDLSRKLGIDYGSQARKIREDKRYMGSMLRFRDLDGVKRKYLCIDLDMLAYWLMTINTKKVKPSSKKAVQEYQKMCSEVAGQNYFEKTGTKQ